ncbi:hypothetical protein C1645_741177 [Glomus cerebriforme]|uniref:Uncharacterized protein n=1 Tax=Glomus cerebriforme TaxID=658196 RepID=A0A397STI8_9GLOM|nr:hypothetical protein C1645_741177 [Glomus cerebriforme]
MLGLEMEIRNGSCCEKHLFILRQKLGNSKQTMLQKLFICASKVKSVWSQNMKYKFNVNCAAGIDYAKSLVSKWEFEADHASQNMKYKFKVNHSARIDNWCYTESLALKYKFEVNHSAGIIYSCCVKSLALKYEFEVNCAAVNLLRSKVGLKYYWSNLGRMVTSGGMLQYADNFLSYCS